MVMGVAGRVLIIRAKGDLQTVKGLHYTSKGQLKFRETEETVPRLCTRLELKGFKGKACRQMLATVHN